MEGRVEKIIGCVDFFLALGQGNLNRPLSQVILRDDFEMHFAHPPITEFSRTASYKCFLRTLKFGRSASLCVQSKRSKEECPHTYKDQLGNAAKEDIAAANVSYFRCPWIDRRSQALFTSLRVPIFYFRQLNFNANTRYILKSSSTTYINA